MTVKLVALYTQPTDAVEFEKHYLEVHAPLVRALPAASTSRQAASSRRPTVAT